MSAGELRERLRFQSPTPTNDGYGNYTEGFTDQFTRAARVRPLKGGEAVLADRLAGTQPVIIRVRVSPDTRQITTAWRAVDTRTGVVYQIKSPPSNMDEKKAYFDMLAEFGVAS